MNMSMLSTVNIIIFALFICHQDADAKIPKDLPEILDYYPNCSYQVIKNDTVKVVTDEPKSEKVNAKLLNRLRQRAQEVSADAVILLKKKIKKTSTSRSSDLGQSISTFRLSYEAEFIKQCIELNSNNRKLLPLNHLGKRVIKTVATRLDSKKFVVTFPQKAKLKRPEVNSNEVSLENGVYGLKVGTDYQQVIKTFGAPSVTLLLHENELVISYGRHHWLYFQNNELVKIQTVASFLSQESLNLVPYLKFFDDYDWEINSLVKRKASLAQVREGLNIDTELNQQNQLLLENSDSTLVLNFMVSKNSQNQEVRYFLSDFTLQANDYTASPTQKFEHQDKQYLIAEQAYLKLQGGQSIDLQDLQEQLGSPLGRITLSKNTELNIYNSHLMVQTNNADLSALFFNENVFIENNNFIEDSSAWQLGQFSLGKSHETLSNNFPDDAYITDDEVTIEAENYTLSLFFGDIDGSNSLYQAKVLLY